MSIIPCKKIAFIILLAHAGVSCSKKETTTHACAVDTRPDVSAAAGQFAFTVSDDIDPCEINGYVVDHQEQWGVAVAADGTLFIDNITPGAVDIILTSGNNGIRLSQVDISAGTITKFGSVDLPLMSQVTGRVLLSSSTDYTGIECVASSWG